MKISVQVIVHPDNDTEASPAVQEVFTLDRDDLAPDTLGLQLAEAKDLLAAVQATVVEQQASAAIARQEACPDCGRARRHKDTRTIVVRSLFGALRLASPRWWHCGCCDQPARTFQPLAGLLPGRTTPELACLQARFAALVSYGITADLLGELFPLGRKLHAAVVRRQTQAVAQRLLLREGTGRKNDPHRFWLPGQEEKWQHPAWEAETARFLERLADHAAPLPPPA